MKLTTVQAAVVAAILDAAAVGLALGVITNKVDQAIVAGVPSFVSSIGVLIIAVRNAIAEHTAAVVAQMRLAR